MQEYESAVTGTDTAVPVQPDTVATDGATGAADTAAIPGDGHPAPEGAIPVTFNHQRRDLSAAEAADYAQKGLKWEAFQTDYDRLRYMAEGSGQTVTELIDGLMEQDRERERQALLDRGGDPELVDQLLSLRQTQREAAFVSSEQEEILSRQEQAETLCSRLAADYGVLRQTVPDIPAFADLPETVIRTAAEQDISLLDAFLRYRYEQERQREAEAARQRAAADGSTGPLHSVPADESGGNREFLAAFERVFS